MIFWCCIRFCEICTRTGVGNLRPTGRIRPAKQHHPALRPFTNCSNFMARL